MKAFSRARGRVQRRKDRKAPTTPSLLAQAGLWPALGKGTTTSKENDRFLFPKQNSRHGPARGKNFFKTPKIRESGFALSLLPLSEQPKKRQERHGWRSAALWSVWSRRLRHIRPGACRQGQKIFFRSQGTAEKNFLKRLPLTASLACPFFCGATRPTTDRRAAQNRHASRSPTLPKKSGPSFGNPNQIPI